MLSYLPLVRRIALRLRPVAPEAEVDELISVGTIGLIEAIDRYDPERGVPLASFAKHLEIKDTTLHIQRQTEKGYDDVESPLPAVLTVTAGVNEPRYPTFKGIMQAKSKPVEQLKVGDLGLSADEAKSTQTVNEVTPAPARGAGEKFEDDGTGAAKVADFLKEAKVI